VRCPHCKTEIADGARFCGSCGNATVATESVLGIPDIPDEMRIIGRDIAGRYRVIGKLGEGGMGAVYRAEQISLKRACAIKLLRTEVSGNAQLVRRFNAEAQVFARLSHPNTVNIYDFGQDNDGTLFIAMELVDGESLRTVLRRGPLSPRRALNIAAQVAASLADAHAHTIVHRDLKPDNVMLQERGKQKDVARVLDFGIAKLRDDSRATREAMTQAGDLLGTPQYMAPEQIRGEPIDGRTDVYALGCMIYEMVTGRMPFEADTVVALLAKHLTEGVMPPTQRRPDLGLPAELDPLVLSAMNKQAAARPATMELYGDMIAQVAAALLMDAAGSHASQPPPMSVVAPSAYAGGAVGPAPSQLAPASAYPPAMPHTGPQPGPPGSPVATPVSASGYAAPNGQAYAPPPARSKLWIPLAAIGAIVVIGLVAYGVDHSRHGGTTAHDDASVTPGPGPTPGPNPPGPNPPPPGPNPPPRPNPPPITNDPWADKGQSPSDPTQVETVGDGVRLFGKITDDWGPAMHKITPGLALPQGVEFENPPGYTSQNVAGSIVSYDAKQTTVFLVVPNVGPDVPMQAVAAFSKTYNLTFDSLFQIEAAGELRGGARFHATTLSPNGTPQPVRIITVAFDGKGYRVALILIASTLLATNEDFDEQMTSIIEDNVKLP
jgi:serine/threonine-protein kinase